MSHRSRAGRGGSLAPAFNPPSSALLKPLPPTAPPASSSRGTTSGSGSSSTSDASNILGYVAGGVGTLGAFAAAGYGIHKLVTAASYGGSGTTTSGAAAGVSGGASSSAYDDMEQTLNEAGAGPTKL